MGERPQELRLPTRFEDGSSPTEIPIPHPGLQAGQGFCDAGAGPRPDVTAVLRKDCDVILRDAAHREGLPSGRLDFFFAELSADLYLFIDKTF